MDLLCCEPPTEVQADIDSNILRDERVLKNLLQTEERHLVNKNFPTIQSEVTELMRRTVVDWMMEVLEELARPDEVFLLAVNYMDRFLLARNIRINHLQLLGTACMFLGSKLREPKPIDAKVLVSYTDDSITLEQLLLFESLILSVLKWDIQCVTSQDFLRLILDGLGIKNTEINLEKVISHAKTLIALCARDYKFSSYLPSLIASASITSALCGLGWTSSGRTVSELINKLNKITGIEQDYLLGCKNQIEEMINDIGSTDAANDSMSTTCSPRPDHFTPPPTTTEKLLEHETAVTPTDVRDVHF